MKKVLKDIARPAKKELFETVYTEDELLMMLYLYVDRIDQSWVCDEMGISLPTLTKKHNACLKQMINFYNYEKFKKDNNELNIFAKYFNSDDCEKL
jgi:hypothetical protein